MPLHRVHGRLRTISHGWWPPQLDGRICPYQLVEPSRFSPTGRHLTIRCNAGSLADLIDGGVLVVIAGVTLQRECRVADPEPVGEQRSSPVAHVLGLVE